MKKSGYSCIQIKVKPSYTCIKCQYLMYWTHKFLSSNGPRQYHCSVSFIHSIYSLSQGSGKLHSTSDTVFGDLSNVFVSSIYWVLYYNCPSCSPIVLHGLSSGTLTLLYGVNSSRPLQFLPFYQNWDCTFTNDLSQCQASAALHDPSRP